MSDYPGFLGPPNDFTRAIAAFDWSATGMGPIADWPIALRTAAGLIFGSDFPTAIWWGSEFWLIHNLAYEREVLRERGRGIGRRFADLWPDVAENVQPQFDAVVASGRGLLWTSQSVRMLREGRLTETWWSYSFTPILDDQGRVLGLFNGATEVTQRVVTERTNALLLDIDAALLTAPDIDAIIAATIRLLGERLGVQRVGFSEIDETRTRIVTRPDWTDGTIVAPPPDFAASVDAEIAGLDTGDMIVLDDATADPRYVAAPDSNYFKRLGVRAAIVCPVHDGTAAVGGLFVQSREVRYWSSADQALVRGAAQRLWQALGRMRDEIARRASEQRYRLIFEQADDIVFTADLAQRITDCNAAGAAAMGMTREALIGRSIGDFVSHDDFTQTTAMLDAKLERGGGTRHEVTVIGADGRRMRWENNSSLIVDRDARPVGLLSISRDVTERRAFEERQSLLIHELNHRVKNTLALVQGIAHQSFRPGTDAGTSQIEFMARLRTLATAHDLLTREQWEGVGLAELVRAATAPLDATRIAASGSAVMVTPKAAVAIAMALYELGTNAVKYGAMSAADGRVDIGWCVHGEAGDARLRLDWRERGGPSVAKPERRGFGVKMIERALASDLGGSVTMDFAPEGVRCAIDAPGRGNIL